MKQYLVILNKVITVDAVNEHQALERAFLDFKATAKLGEDLFVSECSTENQTLQKKIKDKKR